MESMVLWRQDLVVVQIGTDELTSQVSNRGDKGKQQLLSLSMLRIPDYFPLLDRQLSQVEGSGHGYRFLSLYIFSISRPMSVSVHTLESTILRIDTSCQYIFRLNFGMA